jgi:rod shape determining protein RodA
MVLDTDPDATIGLSGWFHFEVKSAACIEQALYLLVGLLVMGVGLAIPTQLLHRYSYLLYATALILLVLVACCGVVVNGSRRWLDLGIFKLQPAEFMKLGLIITMARALSKAPPRTQSVTHFVELIAPVLWIVVPMAIIIEQPDLGTALSLAAVGLGQILFVGVRPRVLVGVVLALCVLAYPAWRSLHQYQQRRIMVLLNPEADPQGSGYHITQSKIAVGSGELFGKGFQKGTQTQLEFLPERTTDFVFSVLAEEWGFIGCTFVLGLYFCLIAALLRVAHRARDLFSCLLVIGVTTQIFAHLRDQRRNGDRVDAGSRYSAPPCELRWFVLASSVVWSGAGSGSQYEEKYLLTRGYDEREVVARRSYCWTGLRAQSGRVLVARNTE